MKKDKKIKLYPCKDCDAIFYAKYALKTHVCKGQKS